MSSDYDLDGLTIPEIIELLRAIRKAVQNDQTLEEFSDKILDSIAHLSMVRKLAQEQIEESLEEKLENDPGEARAPSSILLH